MDERYRALLNLQELDLKIEEAASRVADYEPRLEDVEKPVVDLERNLNGQRERLAELKESLRRLERAAEDKKGRMDRCEERLQRVRNPREEAAARTELDLVRHALEADETDIIDLLDRVRRAELKVDELSREAGKAREAVEPARQQLLEKRNQAVDELAVLQDQRNNHTIRMDRNAARLYERVRAGRTRQVLAELMPDGACGSCFSLVPLQQQAEIRQGKLLARCEACGVILYPVQ